MPSFSRWRGSRIVGPLDPSTREKDLIGGLSNAIERGNSIDQASKSFLNAGYTKAEINTAVKKMSVPGVAKEATPNASVAAPAAVLPNPIEKPVGLKSKTNAPAEVPKTDKKISKGIIIAIVVLIVLILGGAATLGIFWDKLF